MHILCQPYDIFPRPGNPHPVNIAADFFRRIIDHAYDVHLDILTVIDLFDQRVSRCAGSDDHYIFFTSHIHTQVQHGPECPIAVTADKHDAHQKHAEQQIIASWHRHRHGTVKQINHTCVGYRIYGASGNQIHQFCRTGVNPKAGIKTEQPKYRNRNHNLHRKYGPCPLIIMMRHFRKMKIKSCA